jgi:hypothetical protein
MKNAPPWDGGARASKDSHNLALPPSHQHVNRLQVRTATAVNSPIEG